MITEGQFFLFSFKTYAVTSHLQDGSDEGSQHMFLCQINKNYPKLSPKYSLLYRAFCNVFIIYFVTQSLI